MILDFFFLKKNLAIGRKNKQTKHKKQKKKKSTQEMREESSDDESFSSSGGSSSYGSLDAGENLAWMRGASVTLARGDPEHRVARSVAEHWLRLVRAVGADEPAHRRLALHQLLECLSGGRDTFVRAIKSAVAANNRTAPGYAGAGSGAAAGGGGGGGHHSIRCVKKKKKKKKKKNHKSQITIGTSPRLTHTIITTSIHTIRYPCPIPLFFSLRLRYSHMYALTQSLQLL
jgi:hypothetical protein